MAARTASLVAIATALVAVGCATLYGLETPEVHLIGVTPPEGGELEQRFELELRVQNPNDVALELDGVDVVLDVNGARLGRALSGESITIPRLGESTVRLVATTTIFHLVRQLAALPTATELSYEIRGRLFLANSPGRLSFTRAGVLGPDGATP